MANFVIFTFFLYVSAVTRTPKNAPSTTLTKTIITPQGERTCEYALNEKQAKGLFTVLKKANPRNYFNRKTFLLPLAVPGVALYSIAKGLEKGMHYVDTMSQETGWSEYDDYSNRRPEDDPGIGLGLLGLVLNPAAGAVGLLQGMVEGAIAGSKQIACSVRAHRVTKDMFALSDECAGRILEILEKLVSKQTVDEALKSNRIPKDISELISKYDAEEARQIHDDKYQRQSSQWKIYGAFENLPYKKNQQKSILKTFKENICSQDAKGKGGKSSA